jgi:hypothetical protein
VGPVQLPDCASRKGLCYGFKVRAGSPALFSGNWTSGSRAPRDRFTLDGELILLKDGNSRWMRFFRSNLSLSSRPLTITFGIGIR